MEAIILHRALYGEADRILELLTRDAGTLKVIAKHAFKSRKRFGQVLDYFNVLDISARQGRGGLAFLEEASLLKTFSGLRIDLERAELAFSLLAMMRAVVREGIPEPQKFQLLSDALDAASEGDCSSLKPAFQLRLLVLAGVGPNFFQCSECSRAVDDQPAKVWRLVWSRGGLVCGACCGVLAPGEGGLTLSAAALGWIHRASELGPRILKQEPKLPPEVMYAAEQCWQYFL